MPSFCHLEDSLSLDGDSKLASIKRCQVAYNGENSTSSYLSSSLTHHLSTPRCICHNVCWERPSMQNLSPNLIYLHHLHRDAWVMFSGYTVSPPPTKSTRKIWRGCRSTIRGWYSTSVYSDGMATLNKMMTGWRNSRNAMPEKVVAVVTLKKWPKMIRLGCLVLCLNKAQPSNRKMAH